MARRPRVSRQPARLTDRDVAILETLSIARYLTVRGLEWLHIATWLERWTTHQAQTPTKPYYPATYLYERMRFLVGRGLVMRAHRTVQMGSSIFGREDDVYFLTEAGALVVAEFRQRAVEEVDYERKRPKSYFTLCHGVDIGLVYAALRAKIGMKPGLVMQDWQGDHWTAKAYDRIPVQRLTKSGHMEIVKLPVQPDATFAWKHPGGVERIFIEVDRGTRSVATWTEKIHAYAAYMGSPELKARYGTETFLLLTVTPHRTQQTKLMQATAQVVGKACGRYLFCLNADVHPMQIGSGWSRLVVDERGTTIEPYTLIQ